MSTIQASNVVSNGTIVSNTVSEPDASLTINSTGLFVNSFPFVNTSAIILGNSSVNNIFQATLSEPSITVNGNIITSFSAGDEMVNVQIFTTSGTWTKPSWATGVSANDEVINANDSLVIVHLWGAGGGGNTQVLGRGGGGGAFVYGIYTSSQVNATAAVVVGVGGSPGQPGGASSFGNSSSFGPGNRTLTAYGGGGGGNTSGSGGGGGGWLSAGTISTGGTPLPGNTTTGYNSTFGGGSTDSGGAGGSIYGGAAGSYSAGVAVTIYGGGGGAFSTPGGSSVYGGRGGNNTVAATVPGGGGGSNTAAFATGANGKVVVYTLRKMY